MSVCVCVVNSCGIHRHASLNGSYTGLTCRYFQNVECNPCQTALVAVAAAAGSQRFSFQNLGSISTSWGV